VAVAELVAAWVVLAAVAVADAAELAGLIVPPCWLCKDVMNAAKLDVPLAPDCCWSSKRCRAAPICSIMEP
jgi:hypothetical protein